MRQEPRFGKRSAERRSGHRRSRQAPGFTLLEVLIAVLVLSFGVLGVVGLQAASLQANRDARMQSSAVRLGRELADMMRGNKNVAMLTNKASNPYLGDFAGVFPGLPACFTDSSCGTIDLVAQFEMSDWLNRVAAELPGAHVVVCFDRTPYGPSGAPQWGCTDDGTVSVVKIGWTRQSTNRAATGAAAIERATDPSIVLPLIAGR